MRTTVVDWLKSLASGLLFFLVVRTFLLQTFTVISGSMENTLLVGDFLVVNKVAYGAMVPGTDTRLPGYTEPAYGDIIVFEGRHQVPTIDLIKRIVGVPGDTLRMEAGVLYRNGVLQHEPYARDDPAAETPAAVENWGPVVVPAGKYFVLGDNRDHSADSRYWGYVDHTALIGRAEVLYFSWRSTGNRGVRWQRIGRRLGLM